jgi:hypothetical protein
MARWRQVYNEEKDKYELVPITDSSRAKASSADIHGDIESFRSPVDGSIISDRKQLREHNKRNGVVSAEEFSDEYYARKEREIYESWVHHERK